MISQIKKYSPIFNRFFNLDLTLREYSDKIYQFKKNQVYIKRQEVVKKEIIKKVESLFGNQTAAFKINFPKQMTNNIVDHHQFLNHPLLISDNIIANVAKFNQKKKQDAIVVISSGDVPPNNYFSRFGFQLHGKKVPIFSNSESESSSCLLPTRDFNFVQKIKNSKNWHIFSGEEQKFLIFQYEKISSLNFTNCRNYNDQITLIVNNTWPMLFEYKLRKNLPELIYITQEELATNCLLKIIDDKNFITEILFNKEFCQRILDDFRGIVVTWNETSGKGTHFFWRKHPTEKKLLRLYVKNNKLVPFEEGFEDLSINFNKEEIKSLLIKREIFPSLFLIFGVLNFYFGIKPLVGQGSLIYLNLIREQWIKTLNACGYEVEAKNIGSYEIDDLIAGLTLFFERSNGLLKNLYAYDLIMDGGIKWEYLQKIFEKKFNDLLTISVPGIYDYISQKYLPESEKIKPTVTSDDLADSIIDWF